MWKSPWRNRLARSAVNRKVGGSSPPGDDSFHFYVCFSYFIVFFILFWPESITVGSIQKKISVEYGKRRFQYTFPFLPKLFVTAVIKSAELYLRGQLCVNIRVNSKWRLRCMRRPKKITFWKNCEPFLFVSLSYLRRKGPKILLSYGFWWCPIPSKAFFPCSNRSIYESFVGSHSGEESNRTQTK